MDEAATPPMTEPGAPRSPRSQVRTIVFAGMLVLALAAMAVTLSRAASTSAIWGVLLILYAAVSIAWDWQRTRQRSEPVARTLRLQLLHWGVVLVGLAVLLLFEGSGILTRDAASIMALLLLAVGCLLAGVHFDWTFLLLGGVLSVMTIVLGYLEQYMAWIVMIPVLGAVVWFYVRLRSHRAPAP